MTSVQTLPVKPTRQSPTRGSGGQLPVAGSGDPLTDIQRARILSAMTEVCGERGAANVTVAHVVECAGVSRRTFYEIFDDGEDCLLAAIESALDQVKRRMLPAYRSGASWRKRMRRGLTAFLEALDEESYGARLLIVESLGAGRRALELRAAALVPVFEAVQDGARQPRALPGTDRLTAEGVVGAVLSVIHGRLLEGERRKPLLELVNPLMSVIVLPYLGHRAARGELEHPQVRTMAVQEQTTANPLKELHMRLTYRTVRVLMAAAERPGSSNRVLADVAGVGDQGQISKLLARLQRLGLVENAGASRAQGEPNSWTLTPLGWNVHGKLIKQTVAV